MLRVTAQVAVLNPLIGQNSRDTLENLSQYLERLGNALAHSHDDPSIGLFTASCAAALRYEITRLASGESPGSR